MKKKKKQEKQRRTEKKGMIFVHIACVNKCIGLYLFTFVFNFTVPGCYRSF